MDVRQIILLNRIIFFILLCLCDYGLCFEEDYDEQFMPSYSRCPWIKNKLKNGRVKLRSRGRIARFFCDMGYEMAGKRFATCVRGQWNNPLPVCVARGCVRKRQISNGYVTEEHRGAMLVYECNPGYVLDGPSSIYCDGQRWSSEPPACIVTILDPELTCDFEDPGLCGWSHDPQSDFDWKRNHFTTPSGHVGTGPSYDHTFGSGKGGFYLYLEASSPRKADDKTRLFSPVFSHDYSDGCFVFWYHMYGSTTGSLRVYVKPESHVFGEIPPTWEKTGEQGNIWIRGHVPIPHLTENFQIIIEGVRGSSYVGDTAIDDVLLSKSSCESMENDTDTVSNTVAESCRGRCGEVYSEDSPCGCSDDCVGYETCCNDYSTLCTKGNDTAPENPEEQLPVTSVTKSTTVAQDIMDPQKNASTEVLKTSVEQGTTTQLLSSPTETSSLGTEPLSSSSIVVNSFSTITEPVKPNRHSTSTEYVVVNANVTKGTPAIHSVSDLTSDSTKTPFVTAPEITTSYTSTSPAPPSTSRKPTSTRFPSSAAAFTTSTKALLTSTTLQKTLNSTPSSSAETTVSIATMASTQHTTSTTITPTESTASNPQRTTLNPLTTETRAEVATTTYFSTSTRTSAPVTSSVITTTDTGQTYSLGSRTRPRTSTRSTREPYNLRPRNRTTVSRTTYTTESSVFHTEFVSTNEESTTTSKITNSVSETTPTEFSTTSVVTFPLKYVEYSLQTTRTTKQKSTTEPSTPSVAQTDFWTTQKGSSLNSIESQPSKTASKEDSSSVFIIASLTIVAVLGTVAAAVYYARRKAARRTSDDSEMRFLSDNEETEYSDASVLENILRK